MGMYHDVSRVFSKIRARFLQQIRRTNRKFNHPIRVQGEKLGFCPKVAGMLEALYPFDSSSHLH